MYENGQFVPFGGTNDIEFSINYVDGECPILYDVMLVLKWFVI